MQLCPCGNQTHDLLITSSTPYHYATVPCAVFYALFLLHIGSYAVCGWLRGSAVERWSVASERSLSNQANSAFHLFGVDR